MPTKRKRILMSTEASFLASGFGTYSHEVLSRLHDTGKYELAEHATYGFTNDPRDTDIKWRYYANAVRDNDPRAGQYNSQQVNHFGAWRFERVLLDFKPDIVCSPPGELILTENSNIPIENIQLGQKVVTHRNRLQQVSQLHQRLYSGILYQVFLEGLKKPLTLTPNHPVLSCKDFFGKIGPPLFRRIDTLHIGDLIISIKNKTKVNYIIEHINVIKYNGPIYNFEVQKDNSYIIQQACVHNCSHRDPWMCIFENDSPFREFYHLVWMPTVDSAPQKPEWIDHFTQVDGIFTYSDWNYKVLEKESGGKIPLKGTASPAIDTKLFCPIKDKIQHRNSMDLENDTFIIGTVMRNQKRKLFPDLFQSFRMFLDKCYKEGKQELAQKTYLYCHTSYPDLGWNLPQLLKEYGLGHKVLFTYYCRSCHHVFCSLFRDGRTICPKCNNVSAYLPSVGVGISREQLVKIYQLFDLYIQYSITEGFGIPLVEAASCGIPLMAINYSAMEDIIKNTKGFPLPPYKLSLESETSALRAVSDNDNLVEQLMKYISSSDSYKEKKQKQARQGVEQHYTWDRTAKVWEDYFDSIEPTGNQGKWNEIPPRVKPVLPMPTNLSNTDFVNWIYINFLQQPHKLYSYQAREALRSLNFEFTNFNSRMQPFSQQDFYNSIKQRLEYINNCERCRCGLEQLIQEDYLDYANIKESLQEK